jgi:hypothetical protein
MNAQVPTVRVTLLRQRHANYFVLVDRCPFCARKGHTHGAGRPGQDPHENLGSRLAHCGPGQGTYVLDWNGKDEIK